MVIERYLYNGSWPNRVGSSTIMSDHCNPVPDFDALYCATDAHGTPIPVAAVGGAEPTVLQALRTACDRGWVTPIVTGREADMRRAAEVRGIDLAGFTLIDTEEPAPAAVAEVKAGRAKMLMKGQIATPALLKAMLDSAKGLRGPGDMPDRLDGNSARR